MLPVLRCPPFRTLLCLSKALSLYNAMQSCLEGCQVWKHAWPNSSLNSGLILPPPCRSTCLSWLTIRYGYITQCSQSGLVYFSPQQSSCCGRICTSSWIGRQRTFTSSQSERIRNVFYLDLSLDIPAHFTAKTPVPKNGELVCRLSGTS